MCGIAGKIHWGPPSGIDTVKRMCEKLIHRGPDDKGFAELECITLGHTRLSIIDLSSRARQPMISRDKRYYLVYNGEIYNFPEIKKELESAGYGFMTTSDTEVVLYSFIHWGEKCLNRFNGMFAFAIWDALEKKLFFARDRFGKKPLYYYISPSGGISFASELTSLIEDKDIPLKLSFEALNCYLALGYILSPMTMYENIYKLEPATYMFISDEGKNSRKVKYWDYSESFRNKVKDEQGEIENRLLYMLEEASKMRLISDVPVGAFLSGGIDSSSIVSLIKKYHEGELHTFSAGFDSVSYNELPDAQKTADWIGTIHHNFLCRPSNGLEFMNDAIHAFDEPFADNSLIPTIEVSKLASQYVKVVLSGDGADELFAGYVTYQADKYYNYFKPVPAFFKKMALKLSQNRSNGKPVKLGWRYRQKQFFYGSLHSPCEAHYLWRLYFNREERISILGEQYRELINDTDPYYIFEKYYKKAEGLDMLDKNLYVDCTTWLPDDILVKVDRATMNSSIEARCPYLDVNVACYTASIPSNLKLRGFKSKYILKKALKKILPEFVLEKKKSGFNAPVGEWIGYDGIDEFKAFCKYVYKQKIHE